MTFQQSLQSYIQNQNIVMQSEQALKEREDQAEQTKVQLMMARDQAASEIAMGSILPLDMLSRLHNMKNLGKKLMGLKDTIEDNDALKNVKGWAKKKLGMKDTDGDDDFEPDAITMNPITAEDFEEPTMGFRDVQQIGSARVSRVTTSFELPKTKSLPFPEVDLSSADEPLSTGVVRAMPSGIDWEDISDNPGKYMTETASLHGITPADAVAGRVEPAVLRGQRALTPLATPAEQRVLQQAYREKWETGREVGFKYRAISQGQHEYEQGISSAKSDMYAESRNLAPIASEGSSGVVLPDIADLGETGQITRGALGYGERFGGGTEIGMTRAGGQRGSSMLAQAMTGEEGARAMPKISGEVRFRSMPSAWARKPARVLPTTGEEISAPSVSIPSIQAGMEQVPTIEPAVVRPTAVSALPRVGPTLDDPPQVSDLREVARLKMGLEGGQVEGMEGGEIQPVSAMTDRFSSMASALDERPLTTKLSKLRSGLGLTEETLDDEEGGSGESMLSSLIPSSMGEGIGTGLAAIGFGTELYMGITQIKDAFKESALVGKEQMDIARESQAIYNRPTFDFGQQAVSNRDSGLGEASFNHF
mgnify:CR=1 FL=1|jgi:hypothetical protein|tara:strand:+ start:4711 stop:6486 length:1776 start_codon:yes stop_codon:yes gene_type:complete